ncbi:MAG: nucleoside-diphosphate kinase, partial [Bacteroidota bacterium]
MPLEYTFAMIKPSACRKNHVGPILATINQAGFRISAIRSTKLTYEEAQRFYEVHRGKDFYDSLCDFMSSGPIIVLLLQKENAVKDFRKLIGNTNPQMAEEGTIRKMFAES